MAKEKEAPVVDTGDEPIVEGSPALDFVRESIAATKKPDKEKKETPKPGDDEGGDKVTPKPKAKVKPAPARREAPVIDEEKLGEAIGRSMRKSDDEKGGKREEKVEDEFSSPSEQRRLRVLAKMEELNPSYKGLAEKYKSNKKKLADYAKKWESENPGEEFDDSEDGPHADFLAELEKEVDYDDDDYTEALADLRADEKMEKANAPVLEKLSQFERKEKIRESAPKIVAARDAAGNEFWKSLGEEFADVVGEDGNINAEALNAIKEADGDKYNEAIAAVQSLESFAAEMYMLGNSLVTFDKENPLHVKLGEFALACESDMMKAAKEKQLDDEGRQFLPMKKWRALSKEDRADYWTFTPEQLNSLMAQEIARVAQAKIKAEEEKFERRAIARGLKPGEKKPQPSNNKRNQSIEEQEEEQEEGDGKPISPESGGSPRMASARQKGAKQEETAAESWVKDAIG